MNSSFFVVGHVDNFAIKPRAEFKGEIYDECVIYQITTKGMKNGEPFLERYDMRAHIDFGKLPDCIGKTYVFPCYVNGSGKDKAVRVPEGTKQGDVVLFTDYLKGMQLALGKRPAPGASGS